MKQYIVIERENSNDSLKFINEETTGLADIWHTVAPYKIRNSTELKPKIFNDRSEAVVYKNRMQAKSNYDWKNSYHGMSSKPVWRVELYTPELFESNFTEYVEN